MYSSKQNRIRKGVIYRSYSFLQLSLRSNETKKKEVMVVVAVVAVVVVVVVWYFFLNVGSIPAFSFVSCLDFVAPQRTDIERKKKVTAEPTKT